MIINLTQHDLTPEQIKAGAVEVEHRDDLRALLTFQISGPCGLAANLSAAASAVEARARQIVREHVIPVLMRRAAALLREGGYEPGDDLSAYRLVRPEVAAAGVRAMIGGAPFLMRPLEHALAEVGVSPVYALSDRVSREVRLPDGSVQKVSEFRHLGFLEV